MSGTFGEYRAGHFHAGIDLSTNGRIGLPVRAVAAGRVVRLRASPYGYGRAIYIDIDGRRQVVFGHLSAFAPRWQALVEAEQERLGKYTVDFAVPESARVAAGEIVAYTGDSGVGEAHLHFEVREGDTDPINPLTHGWEAEDRAAPVIRALRLVPLGLEGRVDGGLDPVVVSVTRAARERTYRASREHTVSGPVGVEVLAEDRATGCDDPRAIFGASLALDDSVLFESELELVSYLSDWSAVDLRYDAAARAEDLGNFVRLYEPVGWAGAVRESAVGLHRLLVSIRDAAGNESRCELSMLCGGTVESTARAVTDDGGSSENQEITTSGEERAPRVSWRLIPEGVIVRVEDSRSERGRGSHQGKVSIVSPTSSIAPNGGWIGSSDEVGVAPAATEEGVEWFVAGPEELTRYNPSPEELARMFEKGEEDAARRYKGGAGSQIVVRRKVPASWGEHLLCVGPFFRADPGAHVDVVALSRSARVAIPRDGLFGEALLTASAEPRRPTLTRGLALRAEPARFDPADLLLREKAEVRFAVPDSLRPAAARLAVYSVELDGSVECLGGALDEATGEIVATTRALGTFVLLEDASPPRLSRPRPADGAAIANARPRLLVRVAETGEGLDDEGVLFTIDGERLIPEYDPDAGHIVARPKRPLARGPHRVEVRLADKAGNEATLTSRFTVMGRRDN